MGYSDYYFCNYLKEAFRPFYHKILNDIDTIPYVFGLCERDKINLFIEDIFCDRKYNYQRYDLLPQDENVVKLDINDLSPLFGKKADLITIFRSSMFISDKYIFLSQMQKILKKRGFLFIDFLIGFSNLPVLDFICDYQNPITTRGSFSYKKYKDTPCYAKTTFYDDKIVSDFPEEVGLFIKHAKNWPLATKFKVYRKNPVFYKQFSKKLKDLTNENLGSYIKRLNADKNVFSLDDFRKNNFEVIAIHTQYYYKVVKKFSLYTTILAQYNPSDQS